MINRKLILGTASFASGYGIKKNKGLSVKKINKIYNVLRNSRIDSIDTAFFYSGVEKKIGQSKIKNLKIYTKIPKIPSNFLLDPENWILNKVKKSLLQSKQNFFQGVYLHDPKSLSGASGTKIYKTLLLLKKIGYTKKIGVSVYSPEELNKIIDKYKIDIVQFPMNIFDRRFLKNNYLEKIKKKKIEIHVRSIFLQGLLLQSKEFAIKNFKKFSKILSLWEQWNLKNKNKKIETCLNFIFNQKNIDKIVIGILDIKELKEIINFKKKNNKFPEKLFSNNKFLIDPRLWKKV